MVLGKLLDLFDPAKPPNSFTTLLGELVRLARIDSGLNQRELAEKMQMRQASISDIENGKRWVNVGELVALSAVLNKPILYFVPEKYRRVFRQDAASPELDEFLQIAKKLDKADLDRLIIQTRALARKPRD